MIIVRDDKKIKLTRDELRDAYYEMQHIWDKEYISDNLIDQYNDDGSYDYLKEKLHNDPDYCSKVADRYRKYIDDSYGSYTEWSCFQDAINYID